ncbi:MAG: hypothetical protein ACRD96_01255 [Bryobacteraceae bacterium]
MDLILLAALGQIFRYEMKTTVDGGAGVETATSVHEVVVRDGIPRERVRWTGLVGSDGVDYGEAARKAGTMELSLHPAGPLELVKPAGNPRMVGPVTDLYTFFFAVSPRAGVTRAEGPGDVYVRPEPVMGDWSDGEQFLIGQDRTEVRIKLVSREPRLVYETAFVPPAAGGLEMARDWMREPVCGPAPNNFQMVRRQGEQFVVLWGCEEFTTRTEMDSGRIERATMNNVLRWRMRVCMDRELGRCFDQPNLSRRRRVELRRIDASSQ